MKKRYIHPEVGIFQLGEEDIITTSGTEQFEDGGVNSFVDDPVGGWETP